MRTRKKKKGSKGDNGTTESKKKKSKERREFDDVFDTWLQAGWWIGMGRVGGERLTSTCARPEA